VLAVGGPLVDRDLAGQAPVVSFVGLKSWYCGWTENPSEGAPPVLITLPSLPTSFTLSLVTAPAASATSGSARTLPSTDCGKVGGSTVLPWPWSNAALPLTTTSAFRYETWKMLLKPLLIVSVRT